MVSITSSTGGSHPYNKDHDSLTFSMRGHLSGGRGPNYLRRSLLFLFICAEKLFRNVLFLLNYRSGDKVTKEMSLFGDVGYKPIGFCSYISPSFTDLLTYFLVFIVYHSVYIYFILIRMNNCSIMYSVIIWYIFFINRKYTGIQFKQVLEILLGAEFYDILPLQFRLS